MEQAKSGPGSARRLAVPLVLFILTLGTTLWVGGTMWNAGNLSDRLVTIRVLHALGCNVLVFDYRGYGRSEGEPDEEGTYRDGEAAWRYLVGTRGVSPERLILCGRSLGSAVAIELAARHEPAALVVESSFTGLADVARVHYRLLPVGLLCRFKYDSAAKVPSISCPKLFFHGLDIHGVYKPVVTEHTFGFEKQEASRGTAAH